MGASEARVVFSPSAQSDYVILHYRINEQIQHAVNMKYEDGFWQYMVPGVQNGNSLYYWFTYTKHGLQYDTPPKVYNS